MFKTTKFKALILSLVMMLSSTSIVGAATIYATGNDGDSLITIDTDTGDSSVVGESRYPDTLAAAFTPDGKLWTIIDAHDAPQLARFDLETGAATPVGKPMGITHVHALAADSAGTLYAAGMMNGNLYTVRRSNGRIDLVGNTGINGIMDMAFDDAGRLWAVANSNLYTIDPETVAVTHICSFGIANIMGLIIDPMGGMKYVTSHADPAFLYEVGESCTLTPIGTGLRTPYPHGGDIYDPEEEDIKLGECIREMIDLCLNPEN